jgi:hypothetical protein
LREGSEVSKRTMSNPMGTQQEIQGVTEKALLSRWRFLQLWIAGMAGLSLLSLAGCGGGQGGGDGAQDKKHGGGKNGNGDGDDDNGGGGGGY